ncbi:unnamed protein product [Allacma fusca]|uniref:C2H2-type domain-containing protein n=1 Tax=Allacma fusca TaxID=39272 RepID=A0A8J2KAL8_9HEXA|nr:unnamed protein product [Allacma fusca]
MSQPQGPPMEFPPLDGLKLWHLLQTHVSADCGASLKVNFDGNVHPPQHMQDLNLYNEDQRLKMNPQILQNHQHEKIACSCPMCPMQEKKNPHNMKPMEPPHSMNVPINQPQILHQPNHNQNQAVKPPAPLQSTSTSLTCSACHKKIRNSKKQQQAAARNPNYCPICDKCSRSHKDLYNHNNMHGSNSSHAHNNAQNQNSSVYSHNSHNSMNHHSDYNDRHSKASRGECGKQFKCSKCDKYFSNGGNLKRHLMIHTGEKPYTCHVCNKPFRTKTLLSNHIRTHTAITIIIIWFLHKPFTSHGKQE